MMHSENGRGDVPRQAPRRRSANRTLKTLIRKIVVLGIIAVLGAAVYVYYAGQEPPGLVNARRLVEENRAWLEAAAVTDDPAANRGLLADLEQHRTALAGIGPEFTEQHARAGELIKAMTALGTVITGRNSELETATAARNSLEEIRGQTASGALDDAAAISRLEGLVQQYPGTAAATEAAAAAAAIQNRLTVTEQDLLARTQAEARRLADAGDFRQAYDTVQACLARDFRHVPASALDNLRNLPSGIEKAAADRFGDLCRDAVRRAATEDCEALRRELDETYARFGFAALEQDLARAGAAIDAVRKERLDRARAALTRELAAAEKYESGRMYGAAAALYGELEPRISEPELSRDIARRRCRAQLYAAGKQAVIAYVTAANGVTIDGVGLIRKAGEQNVQLEMDGMAMAIGWEKIRDGEYTVLLTRAVENDPVPEALAACGCLLADAGAVDKADACMNKALRADPGIAERFPEVFADVKERMEQRLAAAEQLEAERTAAREKERARQRKAGAAAPAAWEPVGLSGGGCVCRAAISPLVPGLMMVNSDMSGAYISRDAGRTWNMIHHAQLSGNTQCSPAFHPGAPDVIFAAGGYSGKLMISRDQGEHWEPIGNLPGGLNGAIVIDPDVPAVMLAGAGDEVWRSADGGRVWAVCKGPRGKAVGFHIDRTSPPARRVLFAATADGIWRSDDGGESWKEQSNGLPGREIRAFAGGSDSRSGTVILYCILPGKDEGGTYQGGVYRSLDRGATWVSAMGRGINTDLKAADEYAAGSIAQYWFVLTTDVNPRIVYAMNTNTGFWPPHHTTVFRSDDAGLTWQATMYADPRFPQYNIETNWETAANGRAYQEEPYGDAICPTNPDQVLRTMMIVGACITDDGGKTWHNAHTQPAPGGSGRNSTWLCNGLVVTTTWNYHIDPLQPGRHYICYTDIGFGRSADSGRTWQWWDRDAGIPWRANCYELAFDPEIPGKIWGAFSGVHDIPNGNIIFNKHKATGPGGVALSTDSAVHWKPVCSGLPDSPVCSVAIDPRSPKEGRTLYAAVFNHGIFKSTDGGGHWTMKSSGLGAPGINMRVYRVIVHKDGTLFALVTAKREGSQFLKEGPGVYRSRDGGENWECITAASPMLWPKDVTVHPDDSSFIFVGAANAGDSRSGLYRTRDGGTSWQCVASKGPEHFGAYFHPQRPGWVYMTLCEGAPGPALWLSTDSGTTWKPFEQLPFGNVQRVTVDPANPDVICVTTFGASVFRGPAAPVQ